MVVGGLRLGVHGDASTDNRPASPQLRLAPLRGARLESSGTEAAARVIVARCHSGVATVPPRGALRNAPQPAEQSRTLRPIFRSAHDTFIYKDTAALLAQYFAQFRIFSAANTDNVLIYSCHQHTEDGADGSEHKEERE